MQVKKIIIEGEKVHNVGYRPFLLAKARKLGIPNYEADNVEEEGKQKVIVSVGGERKQAQDFVEFAKENYPKKAKVSRIWEDPNPPERVMSMNEYDKQLAAEQQNTVVQSGLGMLDMQKEALGDQRKMLGKQDQMREDMNQNFTTLREYYGRISQTMEKILEGMDNTSKKTEQVLERLTQPQEGFTQAINGLTGAILKLAEKSVK